MLQFDLRDSVFAHDKGVVAGVKPELMQWNRPTKLDESRPVFFSHEWMLSPEVDEIAPQLRYGLLVESQSILPTLYRSVSGVMGKFRAVFTHSDELLKRHSNARWIPGSGTWIGGTYAGGLPGIADKSKTCSLISSRKLRAPLHRRRLALAYFLRAKNSQVDIYMPKLRGSSQIQILETLVDYRYSIVVENFIGCGYFTEKILNCFATGTVPIYWGAPDISDYFDPRGIIQVSGIGDLLNSALPRMSSADYGSRLDAIVANFESGQEYRSIEDFIVRNYLDLFDQQ